MLVGIAPVEIGIAFGVFLLAVVLSGYISLGSISAAIVFPGAMLVRHNVCGAEINGYHILIWFACVVSALILYAHRSNIRRLLEVERTVSRSYGSFACDVRSAVGSTDSNEAFVR